MTSVGFQISYFTRCNFRTVQECFQLFFDAKCFFLNVKEEVQKITGFPSFFLLLREIVGWNSAGADVQLVDLLLAL
jgi:hypothetical protein